MKRKNIEKILIEELDYSPYEAQITAVDLENLPEPLYEMLDQWVEDRTVGEYMVENYSVHTLMDSGYTFPAALIALDWLMIEPDTARFELEDVLAEE